MERMGDILAKAVRTRARRERLPAWPEGRMAGERGALRAGARMAVARGAQPSEPLGGREAPLGGRPLGGRPTRPLRPAPLAGRTTRPLAPDTTSQSVPAADSLDSERILELPAKRAPRTSTPLPAQPTPSAGRVMASTEGKQAGAGKPARARRKSTSGMLSLGEAAQGYAAALRAAFPAEERGGQRQGDAHAHMGAQAQADVCPICHGAGFVRYDVPVGDPSFGQAAPCVCKERALEDRRRLDLRRMSSLDAFLDKTLDDFDAATPGVREAWEVAQRYAEDPHGWLVLSGGYGVGKTHLAAAIANTRLAAGQSVFFSIVPDLLDHLRAAFAPASEMPYDELFDKVREAGLLVLDDLGAENGTAWATEKLFQIINYRYNYRMPTVITTNHRLLAHMDERIRSRLSDISFVRQVVIEAPDFRERRGARPRQGGGQRGGRGGYSAR